MTNFMPATSEETLSTFYYHSEALRYLLSQQPDQTIVIDFETWDNIPQKTIRTKSNGKELIFSLIDNDPERRAGVNYIAYPEISDIINETLGQENEN